MLKRLAIVSDMDNTLSTRTEARPNPYTMETVFTDAPNWPVLNLLDALQRHYPNAATIIVSAREQQEFNGTSTWEETSRWLRHWQVAYDELHLRNTKDYRPDHVIKEELYWEHIAPRYDVLYVLDDRNSAQAPVVDMWRKLGLTCLQVAEGNFLCFARFKTSGCSTLHCGCGLP